MKRRYTIICRWGISRFFDFLMLYCGLSQYCSPQSVRISVHGYKDIDLISKKPGITMHPSSDMTRSARLYLKYLRDLLTKSHCFQFLFVVEQTQTFVFWEQWNGEQLPVFACWHFRSVNYAIIIHKDMHHVMWCFVSKEIPALPNFRPLHTATFLMMYVLMWAGLSVQGVPAVCLCIVHRCKYNVLATTESLSMFVLINSLQRICTVCNQTLPYF